jgi:hypothetical protein
MTTHIDKLTWITGAIFHTVETKNAAAQGQQHLFEKGKNQLPYYFFR